MLRITVRRIPFRRQGHQVMADMGMSESDPCRNSSSWNFMAKWIIDRPSEVRRMLPGSSPVVRDCFSTKDASQSLLTTKPYLVTGKHQIREHCSFVVRFGSDRPHIRKPSEFLTVFYYH